MFDDIDFCFRVKHEVLKILHSALIVAKVSKICGLYSLYGSNVIGLHNYLLKTFAINHVMEFEIWAY